LDFEADILKKCVFPGYLGNTIRGALGKALTDLYCTYENTTDCIKCPSAQDCVYAQLFKSIYRDDQFPSSPNPFAIEVSSVNNREFDVGDTLVFSILMFGRAVVYAEQVISAAGKMFGSFAGTHDRVKLRSVSNGYSGEAVWANDSFFAPTPAVWTDEHADTIESITEIKVTFQTPTQILRNSRLVPAFDFSTFADSLFARIAAIIDIYEDGELILPYGLLYRKPYIESKEQLRKVTVEQKKQPIVGMVGMVAYSGNLTKYMPYIDLGAQLHIGKLTTRGCGQYTFEILK
jgi:hypothetical protein